MVSAVLRAMSRVVWPAPTKAQRQMWNHSVPLTTQTVRRTLYWARLLQRVQHLDGAIVECGVGGGHSLIMIGAVLRAIGSRQPLIGFDSFQGLPHPSADDLLDRDDAGALAFPQSYVESLLRSQLGVDHGVRLHAGWFHETLDAAPLRIALLHLDCDLYDSYRVCLNRLTPRLLPGAIVAVDEYVEEAHRWPGAMKAINAWCAEQGVTPQRDADAGKWHIRMELPMANAVSD